MDNLRRNDLRNNRVAYLLRKQNRILQRPRPSESRDIQTVDGKESFRIRLQYPAGSFRSGDDFFHLFRQHGSLLLMASTMFTASFMEWATGTWLNWNPSTNIRYFSTWGTYATNGFPSCRYIKLNRAPKSDVTPGEYGRSRINTQSTSWDLLRNFAAATKSSSTALPVKSIGFAKEAMPSRRGDTLFFSSACASLLSSGTESACC